MKRCRFFPSILLSLLLVSTAVISGEFDHGAWNTLLQKHVQLIRHGVATVVDYEAFKRDRAQLTAYLDQLAGVKPARFDQWSTADQLAFLINAYNAWTIELILTAWPDIESIKDLGSWFRSPWRKEFVILLGKTRTLDDVEHHLIRDSGRYKDPRIHFAVNCASIGCPALRSEAYVGERLDQQLDEQVRFFLRDRSRNRVEGDELKLSPIFKWYREDFEKGWKGYHRLEDFLLAYREALEIPAPLVEKLQQGEADIGFLDYDWQLNKK